jgi:hypothetical protein
MAAAAKASGPTEYTSPRLEAPVDDGWQDKELEGM